MSKVLSTQGQKRYGQTFGYLVGEPLDWAARGLARLEELEHAKARGASVFRSAPTALGACRLALGIPAVEDNADLF